MASGWCTVCCTKHTKKTDCPGRLLATGDERHGWRISVDTPRGPEACGVLIAQADQLWRARILTYPNILWTIPGGHGSMKFVADSPKRAERQAIAYIKDHFHQLGYAMRSDAPRVEPRIIEPEAARHILDRPHGRPAVRKVRFLPVQYGIARITEKGGTGNLSETGLFVITNSPEAKGRWLNMLLDIQDAQLEMKGLVRWMNFRPHAGRSPGMGIQLDKPPARYKRYVRQLP
jgi:hypothetical protein